MFRHLLVEAIQEASHMATYLPQVATTLTLMFFLQQVDFLPLFPLLFLLKFYILANGYNS